MISNATSNRLCKSCGSTEFYAHGGCKPCGKERTKKWSLENKERSAEYHKSYAELNKQRKKEYYAEYYKKNAEKKKLLASEWLKNNRDKANLAKQKYRKLNPEDHRRDKHNRKAKERNNGGFLSKGIASRLYKSQKGLCPCCNLKLGDDFHIDHIIPLALGGSNTDANVQLLKSSCNLKKNASHPVDYMQSRGFLL